MKTLLVTAILITEDSTTTDQVKAWLSDMLYSNGTEKAMIISVVEAGKWPLTDPNVI